MVCDTVNNRVELSLTSGCTDSKFAFLTKGALLLMLRVTAMKGWGTDDAAIVKVRCVIFAAVSSVDPFF